MYCRQQVCQSRFTLRWRDAPRWAPPPWRAPRQGLRAAAQVPRHAESFENRSGRDCAIDHLARSLQVTLGKCAGQFFPVGIEIGRQQAGATSGAQAQSGLSASKMSSTLPYFS